MVSTSPLLESRTGRPKRILARGIIITSIFRFRPDGVMSGIPSTQLALETENRRLRKQIVELERMLAGELAHQSALSDRDGPETPVDQSHKMLAELVERAPFGIYTVDSQFRIAYINAASQAGVFRKVQPVIGRDLAETMRMLWPDSVVARIIDAFRHTLNTGDLCVAKAAFNIGISNMQAPLTWSYTKLTGSSDRIKNVPIRIGPASPKYLRTLN